MHILIIPTWYPHDEEDITGCFIREQAQALVRYGGYQIGIIFPELVSMSVKDIISCRHIKISISQEADVLTYRTVHTNIFNRIPYFSAEWWIRKGINLFDCYVKDNGRPDIIHAHTMFYGGLLAQRISKKYGVPFIITEHDSGYARGFVKPWQLFLGKKAIESASRYIAVGEKFARLLDNVYGLKNGSWEYVPNMVSTRLLDIPLNRELKNSKHEFVFCTVCNLNTNKGIDILIKAFSLVFEKYSNMHLIIGGDGEEREALERLSKALGISEKVEFLGDLNRNQVADVIGRCDIFVSSSLYETFGIVLTEALALGKPVIATRSGGSESIVHSSNGCLVSANDENALAEAMIHLYENYSYFNSEKIRESCRVNFSELVVVKKLSAIYGSLA